MTGPGYEGITGARECMTGLVVRGLRGEHQKDEGIRGLRVLRDEGIKG